MSKNPIDEHVGNRVRLRRLFLGMSQDDLGTPLGVTFQQIQKYEKGTNRIGAGRLFDISKVLKVDIDYFYDGVAEDNGVYSLAEKQKAFKHEEVIEERNNRETIALINAYYSIQSPKVRKQALDMIKTLSKAEAA